MQQKKPVILMILDGWGYQKSQAHNAIAQAHTPQWDEWWQQCPHMLLNASENFVGLPSGQMGNSEVGHMHIGAGRVIFQDFTRINQAIKEGEFFQNPVFLNVFNQLKTTHKTLHVMGLLSPGGVHSHEDHLFAFLALCHQQHFSNVYLHLFLDGRDTPPQSALESIAALNEQLKKYPVATIASITGRYFAMDRDKRWERLAPLYHLLLEAQSPYHFATAEAAVKAFYQQNTSDEFIPPTRIGGRKKITNGDAVFFFNFRADRARQLTEALIHPDFMNFPRLSTVNLSAFISMTHYSSNLPTIPAYPSIALHHTLGEVIAEAGLTQLRIAETEKYAHVTFFLNGGKEQIFANEDRLLIPSPLVATYDLLPEMSAPELTRVLIQAIKEDAYDVIIVNYANADMVGHSGNFKATIQAIECLDRCLYQVGQTLAEKGGALVITADHGNAECMFDATTNQAHTAHTCEPVPFIYVGGGWKCHAASGSLIDIAPTILTLLNLKKPPEMTGHSLLVENNAL